MSTPFKASSSLLNSPIFRKAPSDPRTLAAYENGTATTRPAGRSRFTPPKRPGFGPYGVIAREHRSWDRAAALGRKRMMGGAGRLPHSIRHHYTEGERAVLTVIAIEVQKHGSCAMPIDQIAAIAGVRRRTVQYALKAASAVDRRHISVEYRQRRGQRNLPNVIRITCDEWLVWLNFRRERAIGCKTVHTKKNREIEGNASVVVTAASEAGACKGLGDGKMRHGPALSGGRSARHG